MELLVLILLTIIALVAVSYAAMLLANEIDRQRTRQLIALRARVTDDGVTGKHPGR
jgi:hypothetical protein